MAAPLSATSESLPHPRMAIARWKIGYEREAHFRPEVHRVVREEVPAPSAQERLMLASPPCEDGAQGYDAWGAGVVGGDATHIAENPRSRAEASRFETRRRP